MVLCEFIQLWDLKTKQERAVLKGHVGPVYWLIFTPSNRRVVSGGADKTLRVWDLTTRKEIHCFEGHTARVRHGDVSPDGKYAVSMVATGDDGKHKELAIVWRLPDEPGLARPAAGAP